MAAKKLKERWLKASFEAVSARKVAAALEKMGAEAGDEGVVVFWTSATPDEISQAIWALNGGCWCKVVEITEDEADNYF